MAMLISKFHRLIQSKLLWGSFLVIIIFTFVIWGTQMPSESRKARELNAAGKLGGEFITQEQFRQAYFNTYMSAVLAVGRGFDINTVLDQQLRESAWRRLAALREAEKMGIAATDQEVMGAIQQHPGFSPEGRFNPSYYSAFVHNVLRQLGFTERQFEQHVREEIVLQKLQNMLAQAAWVSPYEISRTFRSLSDTFDLQYAVLSESNVAGSIQVAREDARKLFLENPEAFRIPEQVRVDFVRIPVSNYLAAAAVTNEDDALAYYDEYMDRFARTNLVEITQTNILLDAVNTNAVMVQTFVTNVETIVTTQVVTIEFDEVVTNILDILTRQAARERAADAATDLVVTLAPDRDGNATSFEEAAAKAGLEIESPGPFALTDEVPGTDAGLYFNQAAFNLNQTAEEYFSDAIPGSNYVYVAALKERLPARIPEFDEIADNALRAARERAVADALNSRAQELRTAALEAVEGDGAFEKAVRKLGLEVLETGEFSLADGTMTNLYADILMRGVLARNQGEVTDALPTEDGAVVIAYVAGRKPGDPSLLEDLRPQIRESVKRQRSRILFESWEASLLTDGGFEDRSRVSEDIEDEYPEEDEEEDAGEAGETEGDEEAAGPASESDLPDQPE